MLGTVRYSQPRHTRGIISEARLSPDSSLLFLSLFFFLIYYVYIYIHIGSRTRLRKVTKRARGIKRLLPCARLSSPTTVYLSRYWSEGGGTRDGRGNECEWKKRRWPCRVSRLEDVVRLPRISRSHERSNTRPLKTRTLATGRSTK